MNLLFFNERLHKWQVLGALVAFSGIAVIGLNIGGNLTLQGVITVLLGSAVWGIGNVISKKLGKVNMISLVIWGSLAAWPPILLLSLWFEGAGQIAYTFQHLSYPSIGALLYIIFPTTLFGFASWAWLVHHHPLSTLVPFTLLVPVLGLLSSALFLGEALEWWKVEATLLVVGGLCINFLGSKFS